MRQYLKWSGLTHLWLEYGHLSHSYPGERMRLLRSHCGCYYYFSSLQLGAKKLVTRSLYLISKAGKRPPALTTVRGTKAGRSNNAFITFPRAGGQVHVKSIIRKVSSAQLVSPTRTSHSAGNLHRGCIDLPAASFLTSSERASSHHRQMRKQQPPPLARLH